MRAIVHIGMPKTGTTTLQNSLHAARASLDRHSVLYPDLERFGHLNHHPLVLQILPIAKLPRQFRFRPAADLDSLATRSLSAVTAELAQHPDHLLLLSSEYLSRDLTPEERDGQRALFDRLGVSEIVFSVYIRRPSAQYLSLLTQGLRQSSKLKALRPLNIRSRIENLAQAFPRARVVPAVFDRDVLHGGDIVADFVARFLAPLGVSRAEVPTQAEANVSVSGESSEILGAFRRDFYPGHDNEPQRASSLLFEELVRIEARLGPRRPRLRPEIAEYLDSSSDYVTWLRDEYALEFPGYNYACASRPLDPPLPVSTLSDVIMLDLGYRSQLLIELGRSPWARKWGRRRWIRSLAKNAPRPLSA
jgi:hypothetical protein